MTSDEKVKGTESQLNGVRGPLPELRWTTQKNYRVDRRQISFLKFIIEAYDGVAMLRTVDAAAGIVALHIAPGCEAVADMILNDLKREIMLEAK